MKSIVTTLFVLLMMPVFGQRKPKEVFKAIDTIQIGRWIETGKNITAVCYTLNDSLQSVITDSSENILIVQTRTIRTFFPKSFYRAFRLSQMELLWESDANYFSRSIRVFRNFYFVFDNSNIKAYNVFDNQKIWEKSVDAFLWKDGDQQLLIRSRLALNLGSPYSISDVFFGIHPLNGKVEWSSKMSLENGLLTYMPIDDTSFLVMGDGLRRFHVSKGEIWQSPRKYSNSLLLPFEESSDFVCLHRIHDEVFMPDLKMYSRFFWGLNSNILVDSGKVYSVHRDGIDCNDLKNGQWNWILPLSDPSPSHSILFLTKFGLLQVDQGWANVQNSRVLYGKPALRLVSPETGKLLFSQVVGNGNDVLSDAYIADNNEFIYLVFQNRIGLYDIKSGKFLKSGLIDLYAYRGDYSISTNKYWESLSENLFVNAGDNPPNSLIVTSSLTGHSLKFDSTLNLLGFFKKHQLYQSFTPDKAPWKGLLNSKEVVFANSKGEALCKLNHKADEVLITAGYLILVCDKENQIVVLRKEDVLGEAL